MFAEYLRDLSDVEPILIVLVALGVWALIVELRDPTTRGERRIQPTRDEGPHERGATLILLLGLWALASTALDQLDGVTSLRPWDLAVYTHAAPALLAGFDPYDAAELARVSGQHDLLSCYYPPLTVALFAPLAAMELARAGLLVLGLKLALLAGLVWAWTRRLGPWVPLVTATLWAYAIQIDLNSGNVSVFEQALLWSGVAALLAGRRLAFAGLIACAAVFKLELISMAALALVVDPRHGWRPLVLALAGLSAYLLLGLALFPGPSESWYVAAQDATFSEGGYNAPSLAAALLHLGATPALVVLAVLIVIAGSIGVLWRAREQPVVTRLMFAILALTLTWPRLKNYGFIVLIPPAACTITWLWGRSERWPAKLAIAGLLAALLLLPREFEALGQQNFLPTLLLVLLWIAGAATLLGSRR